MFPRDTVFGVFLIFQLCIGVPGNSFLFLLYMHTFLFQHHVKKIMDPIFSLLMLANTLTITFTLIPHIMSSFEVRWFWDNVGCKAVLYTYRVTRGVSLCTTSLLSAFQAITVSPNNSKWAWLKCKLSTWTCPWFLFFWILNMLIYIRIIETVTARSNFTLVGHGYVDAYCQTRQFGNQNSGTYILSLLVIRDLVSVLLMISTSLYMVNLLYRHRRRAQHLHSPHVSSQTSPEHKATRTILLLVGWFVFFYFSNNCLTLYLFYAHKKIPSLEGISTVLSSCYPTICPFLLMKNNKIVSQLISSFSLTRITGSHGIFNGLTSQALTEESP
ncbi:vomeronasal type-1 receptor 4 [Ictidomys tridecemlineatus]|uniref:vomeronasal type-1 receptor 4-like n=1 Tax=Ictidomys tridecemlineatus TaxID=43179 RepID=UPI000681687F|nr:vomeronasal type-1 receptor 4-like [Ictidomys tridecemlineatus]KAG3256395.1 vomeronasal type-1 receptor 4-like [Ictidomys tridecemlineatus]